MVRPHQQSIRNPAVRLWQRRDARTTERDGSGQVRAAPTEGAKADEKLSRVLLVMTISRPTRRPASDDRAPQRRPAAWDKYREARARFVDTAGRQHRIWMNVPTSPKVASL